MTTQGHISVCCALIGGIFCVTSLILSIPWLAVVGFLFSVTGFVLVLTD